jgi:hypothetical protein
MADEEFQQFHTLPGRRKNAPLAARRAVTPRARDAKRAAVCRESARPSLSLRLSSGFSPPLFSVISGISVTVLSPGCVSSAKRLGE